MPEPASFMISACMIMASLCIAPAFVLCEIPPGARACEVVDWNSLNQEWHRDITMRVTLLLEIPLSTGEGSVQLQIQAFSLPLADCSPTCARPFSDVTLRSWGRPLVRQAELARRLGLHSCHRL